MSDRDRRTPPPVAGVTHQSDADDAGARERESAELDRLIEDFCASARAAAALSRETQATGSATGRRRSASPRLSLPTMRTRLAHRRHDAGNGIGPLFLKAGVIGIAVGLLAFGLVHSDLLRKPAGQSAEPDPRLVVGSAVRAAVHTAPTHAAPDADTAARRTTTAPPAALSLPDFKFSTWPVASRSVAQTDTPAKRWDFLNSATGAITSKPARKPDGPVQGVPLPTRPEPGLRDQLKGDEKPLADEKPINGEPGSNIAGPTAPAGRDRAETPRRARRRTTRKFLLGRGPPRKPKSKPKTKSNRALRPSAEPPPHPRPQPARAPRADARTGHQLRLGQRPREDFLGFIRPTPRPDWARRAIEN